MTIETSNTQSFDSTSTVPHRNAMHFRASTKDCPLPDARELRATVEAHATADIRIHRDATARFAAEWARSGLVSHR